MITHLHAQKLTLYDAGNLQVDKWLLQKGFKERVHSRIETKLTKSKGILEVFCRLIYFLSLQKKNSFKELGSKCHNIGVYLYFVCNFQRGLPYLALCLTLLVSQLVSSCVSVTLCLNNQAFCYDVMIHDVMIYDIMIYDIMTYDVLTYATMAYDVMTYNVIIICICQYIIVLGRI